MKQDWKVESIRKPEQVFEKIKNLPTPTVVVVIGADSVFKEIVFDEFCDRLIGTDAFRRVAPTGEDAESVSCESEKIGIVRLAGRVSCECTKRKKFLDTLRKFGAASVVGVYAKMSPFGRRYETELTPAQLVQINQASMLTATPPTADGLDYLVTVRE